jgi:hypothetical protein
MIKTTFPSRNSGTSTMISPPPLSCWAAPVISTLWSSRDLRFPGLQLLPTDPGRAWSTNDWCFATISSLKGLSEPLSELAYLNHAHLLSANSALFCLHPIYAISSLHLPPYGGAEEIVCSLLYPRALKHLSFACVLQFKRIRGLFEQA